MWPEPMRDAHHRLYMGSRILATNVGPAGMGPPGRSATEVWDWVTCLRMPGRSGPCSRREPEWGAYSQAEGELPGAGQLTPAPTLQRTHTAHI